VFQGAGRRYRPWSILTRQGFTQRPGSSASGPGGRAHLVGALRVDPHQHNANYPPPKGRGFARDARLDVYRRLTSAIGVPCLTRVTITCNSQRA